MVASQCHGVCTCLLRVGSMRQRCLAILTAVVAATNCSTTQLVYSQTPQQQAANAPSATTKKLTFDHVGPQIGEQLPDLRLQSTKDEPQRLGNAWHSGPALIVTSSFTCPKSRSRWPELAAITKQYGEKLNIVVVYVIEAHPVGSICPYKGVEDVTPENQRDGILRKQPTTMADRLDLAQEFKRYLRVDAPIYVDKLDNRAWKALGAAPNIAYLVDNDGIVVARQGWFDGPGLRDAIDDCLTQHQAKEERQNKTYEKTREVVDALQTKLATAGINPWELNRAVRGDKADKLATILKKFPEAANYLIEPEQTHHEESTLLMDAAAEGNVAAAELLLKHGADIHARSRSFDSPLQAARFDNLEMIKLLLRHKADVNVPETGRTPVHEALIGGHTDAAKLLIEAGGKEDLYSNIAFGKIDHVQAALAADPSRAGRPDGASRMPLDYAAADNQLQIAKLLIESGAPVVDYELSATKVPLHYAIHTGNLAMAKLLLDSGHSPNTAEGRRGESATSDPALHMAIAGDKLEIIKLLLDHKADLKTRNTYSLTPLHLAAESGKANIVAMLIKAGADVNAKQQRFSLPCGSGEEETPQLNTPLHLAAARGNPDTINALLTGKANINAANVRGETPLMSSLTPPLYTPIDEESQQKNMEALLSAGASVNLQNGAGETALDIAIARQSSAGKDVTAEEKRHAQRLIDLLKKFGAKPGKKQ
jgi:ankyrin repeat protein